MFYTNQQVIIYKTVWLDVRLFCEKNDFFPSFFLKWFHLQKLSQISLNSIRKTIDVTTHPRFISEETFEMIDVLELVKWFVQLDDKRNQQVIGDPFWSTVKVIRENYFFLKSMQTNSGETISGKIIFSSIFHEMVSHTGATADFSEFNPYDNW